jgi:hypothetical protein
LAWRYQLDPRIALFFQCLQLLLDVIRRSRERDVLHFREPDQPADPREAPQKSGDARGRPVSLDHVVIDTRQQRFSLGFRLPDQSGKPISDTAAGHDPILHRLICGPNVSIFRLVD